MADANDQFVFAPLGGLGEIGMNAALYGFGPKRGRKWIMVDLGVAFGGPDQPGVDLIMPDISFVESVRKDLLGLVITHAHEDHVGAIASLWSRLKCPIYATPFAAGLLEVRRLGEPGAPKVDMRIVAQGARFDLGPFSIEYIPVSHSIPESSALAIRTPLGTVLHSGDWKLDATPVVGWPTDEARLRAIGAEGVLALVSDSTNILREGQSPSEADVSRTLHELIGRAKKRVVVTTFASNVARLRSVAEAAFAAGRSVVIAGRAMERCVQVSRECGYLDGLPAFLSASAYPNIPPDRVVLLATGSQGEPRAAMMRIAVNDHPDIKLGKGDLAIFSSRAIPGNERSVNEIINGLTDQGVEVLTDRDGLVHASGHPRRGEVGMLYDWLKPKIAIPAHGEAMHLKAHGDFARSLGVPHVVPARNGDLVQLAPGDPCVIDQVPHGRLHKDGDVLVAADDESLHARMRLSHAGIVSVGLALNQKGDLAGEADVLTAGLPSKTRSGGSMDDAIDEAIFSALEGLPRTKRRDLDSVSIAVERAVRNSVRNAWGKRPTVHVLVMPV